MKSYTILKKSVWTGEYEQVQVTESDHVDEYEVEYTEYLDAIDRKIVSTRDLSDLSDLEAELEDALVFEGDSIIKKLTRVEARYARALGYSVICIRKGLYKIKYQS